MRSDASAEFAPSELASRDGARAFFTREHNLRVRAAGEDDGTLLTNDGEPYWDCGSSPEGNTSAVTTVMRKLLILANALVRQDRTWTAHPPRQCSFPAPSPAGSVHEGPSGARRAATPTCRSG